MRTLAQALAMDVRLTPDQGIASGSGGRAKPAAIDTDQIAIDALGSIASEPDRMPWFLDLTGIEAAGIRRAAARPGLFVGVLDVLPANDNDVVAFSHTTGMPPENVQVARDQLEAGR